MTITRTSAEDERLSPSKTPLPSVETRQSVSCEESSDDSRVNEGDDGPKIYPVQFCCVSMDSEESPEDRKRRLAKERKKRWMERQKEQRLRRIREAEEQMTTEAFIEAQKARLDEAVQKAALRATTIEQGKNLGSQKQVADDETGPTRETAQDRKKRLARERKKRWLLRQNELEMEQAQKARARLLALTSQQSREIRLSEVFDLPKATVSFELEELPPSQSDNASQSAASHCESAEQRRKRMARERKKRWALRQSQQHIRSTS